MSVRGRLAAIHPVTWAVTAIVVAGLIAWPLGGWATVRPSSEDVPRLAVGETHRGEQFATRIVSATVGTASPHVYDTVKSGQSFLIVTVDIENVTDRTQSATYLADLLRIPGLVDPPDSVLASDLTGRPDLVPGLRMRLLLLWKVKSADFPVGHHVPVSIVDRTPYEQVLLAGTGWRDPTVAAVTTLTLRPGPVAVPESSPTDGGPTDGGPTDGAPTDGAPTDGSAP